jgi:outer membrane receptor protein involved in Fe transport
VQAEEKSFWDRFRLARADAAADSRDAAVDTGPAAAPQLEEVVVTAQKRVERLIDTPQSVTALSADDLAKMGAVQFRDWANTVPGLNFTTAGAGFTQISLRGVTTGVDNNPTVGVYVDDVPYGSSTSFAIAGRLALDAGLFDIDRIEVLRGPQGTLYGSSAMGGIIKYVTKQPNTDSFSGEAQAGISSTQDAGIGYNAAMAVNLPIVTDKAAVRASAYYSHDGGYIDNLALDRKDVNRSGIYGGRVDLLLKPADALIVRISGSLQNISRDGNSIADYTRGGVPVDGSLDQRRRLREPFDQHFRLIDGTVSYDFGPVALTSISSYQAVTSQATYDLSSIYVPSFSSYSAIGLPQEFTTDKFTQEVRLASVGANALEWLIGGFYTRENTGYSEYFTLRDLAGAAAANDLYTASYPSHYKEYAGFGDVTYHLTRQFDVTAGIRYAHNDQDFSQIGSGLLGVSNPTRLSSEGVSTYLANARYRFSDRATAYVRYATGYRPGGPNFIGKDPATGTAVNVPSFESDRLRSYEIGFKAETADRRFGIDASSYLINWTNIQVRTFRDGISLIENASGGAKIQGAELALTARPIRNFTASGAFAYQHGYLNDAQPDLRASKGERLPNVPRFTAAVNADYQWANGELAPTVGATVKYVSNRTASFDGNLGLPQYALPAYTTVDLRTGVAIRSIDVQLYLHNLFDKRGQLSAIGAYSLPGETQVTIMQPRTIGLTATTRF